jgi:hypothetical protein
MATNNFEPVWGSGYGAPQGPPPKERLTHAAEGFPVPSEPGARQDNLNGIAHAVPIRHAAAAEARQLVMDNRLAILLAEAVAQGVRRGHTTSGGLSIDPNLLDGNTRAKPVNVSGKFVITPANPSAAQLAAAALLAQANFAPGAYPAIPYTDKFAEDYQTGIVQGVGPTVKVKLRPSEVLVIDSLGVTTFSPAAEYELLWLLTYGLVNAAGTQVPNASNLLIPQRRGWPFGTAEDPAELFGMSRLAPSSGPTKKGETDVYLNARFSPATPSGGVYTPWPHYVEITLRGWKVMIGSDGLAMATNVGGPITDANGGY